MRRVVKEFVELLLQQGAAIDAKDKYGCTALHQTAAKGCQEAVVLLLQRGAAIDATDNRGATPLGRAVAKGHVAVVNLLWEYLCEGLSRDRRAVVATER